jgi:hypothetical protein
MKMMKLFLGISLVVLAVAIAVVPYFNTCKYNGKNITTMAGTHVEMKCNWSAQAEIVVGASLLVVGILTLFSRRKETASFLAIIGIVLGAAVILIPTKIIGVCSSTMPCNEVMRPFLVVAGAFVIALCVIGLVVFLSNKESK